MEEVTRKRVMRRLEALPDEQLYQVLDYIEFMEAKYARAAARTPDPFQRFAERVEDQMRVRSVAPKAVRGTMKLMSTAGKVLDGVRDLGRDIGREVSGEATVERSRTRSRDTGDTREKAGDSASAGTSTGNGGSGVAGASGASGAAGAAAGDGAT